MLTYLKIILIFQLLFGMWSRGVEPGVDWIQRMKILIYMKIGEAILASFIVSVHSTDSVLLPSECVTIGILCMIHV